LTVHGFNLNFEGIFSGSIGLWMYKFKDSWQNEYSSSERFDPDHAVWIQSVQSFYETITNSLPLVIRPASVQMMQK